MSDKNRGRDMSAYPSTAELRAWAMERRPDMVQPRGGLPKYVIVAWNRAHPERPFVKTEGHHGTNGGYASHDCRCDQCLEAVRNRSRDVRLMRNEDLADEFAGGAA